MSGIVLYGPANAPFTEKVRRALIQKGLEFELREPTGPEDFQRWSPKTGLLPVLEIDGEHIADSTDILYRLDELYPDPPLLSSDPRIAGQQRQLEDWADENLAYHFSRWRQAQPATDPLEQLEREPQKPSALKSLISWLRAGGTWERPEISVLRGIGDRLDDLIGFLGARPFFYSDKISMADLSVYSLLMVMERDFIEGSAKLLAARPTLIEFMRRVEAATGG